MKRDTVTMNDVARLAGVSTMTVSNVISNRVRVSDKAKARVLEAIRTSGYQVNPSARALKSGRSGVIGLAVPQVRNPYFGMLADLLIEAAEPYGYRVAIEQTRGVADGEAAAIAQSRTLQLDGLILSAVELNPLEPPPPTRGYPIVMLGEQDIGDRFDHIILPNETGTAAATEHLLDRGCRRVAIVTGPDLDRLTVVTRRYNGYRAALERRGIRPDSDLRIVLESLSPQGGRMAGRQIAEAGLGIDGLVAITDTIAIGLMRGLRDRGVRVPEDIRVVGFDGIPASELSIPSLSTIAIDHRWTAAKALDLILARITDPALPPNQYTAPFEMVARESTV
ncbi:LacI family DNA-binding transcriptional regulator [Glycomyces salinus]|uniref:LacI family DNA-binding transcriptional regulator n=1 Tax=Glycomyces salinus TaxID=980294 RepID=UPI0018EB4552|nr:LacI family DNA-binding transcriptional regulator [Glycomyces salinus]